MVDLRSTDQHLHDIDNDLQGIYQRLYVLEKNTQVPSTSEKSSRKASYQCGRADEAAVQVVKRSELLSEIIKAVEEMQSKGVDNIAFLLKNMYREQIL